VPPLPAASITLPPVLVTGLVTARGLRASTSIVPAAVAPASVKEPVLMTKMPPVPPLGVRTSGVPVPRVAVSSGSPDPPIPGPAGGGRDRRVQSDGVRRHGEPTAAGAHRAVDGDGFPRDAHARRAAVDREGVVALEQVDDHLGAGRDAVGPGELVRRAVDRDL